ncbi:SMP-30/gluconolactonase/LRE family protein [Candidatus Latescibacterota bacterium]
MQSSKRTATDVFTTLAIFASILLVLSAGCTKEQSWKSVNEKLITEYRMKERFRDDIPETGVISNLEPGGVTNINNLPETEIAPGATGRIFWGNGNLVNLMTLAPGAGIPVETLPCERIMIVMKGSVEQLINDAFVTMRAIEYERMTPVSGNRPQNDFVYLEKGTKNAVKAGGEGAEIIEIYWPVRRDYLEKAGVENIPASAQPENYNAVPSIEPNRIYNYYNVQFSELIPGTNSRLISGRGAQLSFIRMDPGIVFGHHNHPEEQVTLILRGWIDEIILDGVHRIEKGDILYLPAGMVHGGTAGPFGCDALDVFWPVRPDYTKNMKKRLAVYNTIIPEDAEIELVADGSREGPGLVYCEGPSWVNGKLYFSSMGYDAEWNGDPGNSALVEMDPDGTYRYVSYGEMETNGTILLRNGNLAVCDMYGHRVVEMTTSGKVVRTLASHYNGKRLDGPNDIDIDDKGGIYFTDPQILPPPHIQPGRSVFYIKPNGDVIRVLDPGLLIKPNGLILSPDCKTLYVNSTPEDFMMAFDVNEDGTLSNGRKFGKLFITPEELDRERNYPQVDGMTVDMLGNVYITSIIGLQIFSREGEFIGIIHFPVMPVNCCFGDADRQTLYVNCNDRVYKIRTNVKGRDYTR